MKTDDNRFASETIEPANRQYVFRKADPAHGLLKSVTIGFDNPKPNVRVLCPKPFLSKLAIEMTLTGNANLFYEDRRVEHAPGSLMLMVPDLEFYEIGEENWRSCCFVLWGALADTFCAEIDMRSLATALTNVPGEIRFNMFEACRLVLKQPAGWQWLWLGYLISVLSYVHRQCAASDYHEGSLIRRSLTLMEETLTSPLSLPQIADKLHVSLSTLAHQFRNETGVTPGLTYRRMRIDKAKQLLANGMNVTETSEQMGFENPFHFSRLFKQMEGIPPSIFQEAAVKITLKRS